MHRRQLKRGTRTVLSAVLSVALLASSGCSKDPASGIEPMEPLRAQCAGRHQISLPERFELQHAGSSATFYFGHGADFETVEFQLAAEGVDVDEFIGVVGSRAEQIAAEINEKTAGPMLLAHEDLGNDAILLRYHRSDISDRSHVHEIHRLVDGTHVFLQAESYNGVMAPVEARLKELASRVDAVGQDSGAVSGFCQG